MTGPEPTRFLPAETAAPEELARQVKIFASGCAVTVVLDGMQNLSMIVNLQRQAVWVNASFRAFLLEHNVSVFAGERMGALAGCQHPAEAEGACGTTEACRFCGSALAIAAALEGKEAVKECRIVSRHSGDELELRIQAKPFKYEGEDFLLISMADISADKRRQVLEKLFFHDVLNTAGGVQGLVALMQEAGQEEVASYVPLAYAASNRLVDQILSHKELATAERGELQPHKSEFLAAEFLEEVAALYRAHESSRGRHVKVSAGHPLLTVNTDRSLLSRVIGNLVKNALEAESDGSTVTLSCARESGRMIFQVHNPRQMPEETRLQIFQRSFSTKGEGRGLGTYSIRLLTERYLKGRVTFTSGAAGTAFRVELPEQG